jgi:hypothetical protein
MTKTSFDRMPSRRSSLSLLLVATSFAATLACGLTDDDDKGDKAQDADETDTAALEPGGPGGNTPNGLAFPMGVQDWGVVGAATRADQGELHVVVGNAKAVQAARSGQTNPWPDGSALAHLAFKAEQNPDDAATVGPGAFSAVTLMMKDSTKYAADGGWAYGAWMGDQLTPPAAADFDRACVNFHTQYVQDKDYVFTDPGQLPTQADVDAAADAPNGVAFPDKILDWRVIGVARVSDPNGGAGTLRVIVGNPTAVTAARSGKTEPWPDGSMISHYVWAAGNNPATDEVLGPNVSVSPGGFGAFTLMQRSSAQYGDKGNWDYGVWQTGALNAQTDPNFSQGCVDCHTSKVASRDMVFSRMAEFPAMMNAAAIGAR